MTQLIATGHIWSIKFGDGRRRVGVTHEALLGWVGAHEAAKVD